MLFEFCERRFSFADADRELMASPAMIDDASRDYENCGSISYGCFERINLEKVIGVLSLE